MSDNRAIRKLQRLSERRKGRDDGEDSLLDDRGGDAAEAGDAGDAEARRKARRRRSEGGEVEGREKRPRPNLSLADSDAGRSPDAADDEFGQPRDDYGRRSLDRFRGDVDRAEGRTVDVPSDRPVEVPDDERFGGRDIDLPDERAYELAPSAAQDEAVLAEEAYSRGGNALAITSFLVIVVIPTILTALFYIFIATNQYSTTSQFSIRSASGTTSTIGSSSSMLGGMSSFPGTEILDSFVVLDYINSRDMVAELEKKLDLRAIYDRPEADFYYRFNPTLPIEDFVSYLEMMIQPEYNTLSNVITLTVRAFRPADSQLVAENVIAASERLVNDLSRRAREDSLREARAEVARAEQRLRLTRTAIASFRGNEVDLDPESSASAQQTVISDLESEVATMKAQLNANLPTMSETSPRIIQMRNQIAAMEEQILAERLKVADKAGTGLNTALSERLTRYEELLTEREFAEQTYVSALGSLEGARMQADRQQRYVSVFVTPRLPEYPLYPQGMRWTAAVLGLSLLIWGVFCIMVAGVRDNFV